MNSDATLSDDRTNFAVGDRVFYETENNGPILRGKIKRIYPPASSLSDAALIEWEDGFPNTAMPLFALQRSDESEA